MIKNELAILYNTLYLNGFVKDNNGTNSTLIYNAIEIIDKLQKENESMKERLKDFVNEKVIDEIFNDSEVK